MREELELKLEQDFPFMKRNKTDEAEKNTYRRWGCECSDGWYNFIHNLCQDISDRYAQDDEPIDIIVQQIKEKFASLRFYYCFADSPHMIHAFDFLGNGKSLRLYPKSENEDSKKEKLRQDIAKIVREYEAKSKMVCELCGKEGSIRTDRPWIRTLCDDCNAEYLQKVKKEERKKN